MTALIEVKPSDRCDEWMTLDMRDEEDVGCPIVIPLFGPDHYAGMDCWCCPIMEDGVIVHEACH